VVLLPCFDEASTMRLWCFYEAAVELLLCFCEASVVLLRGFCEASMRLLRCFYEASAELLRSFYETSTKLLRSFCEASTKLLSSFCGASVELLRGFYHPSAKLVRSRSLSVSSLPRRSVPCRRFRDLPGTSSAWWRPCRPRANVMPGLRADAICSSKTNQTTAREQPRNTVRGQFGTTKFRDRGFPEAL